MAERLPAFVPRVAAIVLVVLCATAGLTYAAGSQLPSAPAAPPATTTPPPPLVVPDVRGQAYVFAKGTLEESGFAWRVAGSVQGYAANVVIAQSPVGGTKLVDTGTPLVTLTLKRNASYKQVGEAQNASPYPGSVVQPSATDNGLGPALPATTTTRTPAATPPAATTPTVTTRPTVTTAPATTTTPATTTIPKASTAAPNVAPAKAAAPAQKAAWPKNRPVAFTVPGAKSEPLDEMPLPARATALMKWLDAHPKQTPANAQHWLYQNEWILAGARMGWWHGAEALRTLVAVDRRTAQLWGVGAKSAGVAEQALNEVQARSK
jgi:hypothetical protein